MKLIKVIFLFYFIIGMSYGNVLAKENPSEEKKNNHITNTLIPYLDAVKKGDLKKLKQFLSEEQYKAYRVLLEQNAGYSAFLRSHYKDVAFQVKEVAKEKGGSHYEVEAVFPDGKKEVHTFIVENDLQ